jgi:hypothetical protein
MYIINSDQQEALPSESSRIDHIKKLELVGRNNILEATSQRLKVLDDIFETKITGKKDGPKNGTKGSGLSSTENTEIHSSASTFGVPTTPKTTPWMLTPNPLSPINSQSDLNEYIGDNITSIDDMLSQRVEDQKPLQSDTADERDKISEIQHDLKLFKARSPPLLAAERMTAGSKK